MKDILRVTRIGAYGLIVHENKILLCRLSKQITKHEGKWTLPGGGLNFGESPADAMIREVTEETGLVCKPESIAGIDSMYFEENGVSYHNIRIIYKAGEFYGKLTDEQNGSTDKCEWVSLNELKENTKEYELVDLAIAGLKFL